MLSAVSALLSTAVSAVSGLWETAIENPRNTVWAIAAFLVWIGGVYGGYWFRGTQVQAPDRTTVEFRNQPGTLERLLGGTVPDRATRSKAPDSSEVDTVRVRVPKYITKTDTVFRPTTPVNPELIYETPNLSLRPRLKANPYGFLLLPTPGGVPSVTVTEDRTRIRALDPRNAAELQLDYDHPEPRFSFGPLVRASGTYTPKFYTSGVLGAWVRFRGVRVDGGYRFSTPDRTGPTVSFEWSPDTNPF